MITDQTDTNDHRYKQPNTYIQTQTSTNAHRHPQTNTDTVINTQTSTHAHKDIHPHTWSRVRGMAAVASVEVVEQKTWSSLLTPEQI